MVTTGGSVSGNSCTGSDSREAIPKTMMAISRRRSYSDTGARISASSWLLFDPGNGYGNAVLQGLVGGDNHPVTTVQSPADDNCLPVRVAGNDIPPAGDTVLLNEKPVPAIPVEQRLGRHGEGIRLP